MSTPRVLVFAGSARRASLNTALSRVAAESARKAGLEVTWIDLRDFPIPLYDGDLEAEQGIPEHARRLRQLLDEHQGLIIVSPEYNGFITPLIKNTLDWISRPDGEVDGLASFRNKVAFPNRNPARTAPSRSARRHPAACAAGGVRSTIAGPDR